MQKLGPELQLTQIQARTPLTLDSGEPPTPPVNDPAVQQLAKAKKVLLAEAHTQWELRWETYRRSVNNVRKTPAQSTILSAKTPLLYDNLSKGESSLAIAIRTEKIGLAAFLARCGVPGIMPPCYCGSDRQTAKHLILFCTETEGQ